MEPITFHKLREELREKGKKLREELRLSLLGEILMGTRTKNSIPFIAHLEVDGTNVYLQVADHPPREKQVDPELFPELKSSLLINQNISRNLTCLGQWLIETDELLLDSIYT